MIPIVAGVATWGRQLLLTYADMDTEQDTTASRALFVETDKRCFSWCQLNCVGRWASAEPSSCLPSRAAVFYREIVAAFPAFLALHNRNPQLTDARSTIDSRQHQAPSPPSWVVPWVSLCIASYPLHLDHFSTVEWRRNHQISRDGCQWSPSATLMQSINSAPSTLNLSCILLPHGVLHAKWLHQSTPSLLRSIQI